MKFREGTLDDGLAILKHLRFQQQATLEKLGICSRALLNEALKSPAVTVLVDNKPAAMYGIRSESLIGQQKIWLITTKLIEREPIAFLRNSRRITQEFYEQHGILIGLVDRGFSKSRAWMEWCGFEEIRRGEDFIVMGYSGGH